MQHLVRGGGRIRGAWHYHIEGPVPYPPSYAFTEVPCPLPAAVHFLQASVLRQVLPPMQRQQLRYLLCILAHQASAGIPGLVTFQVGDELRGERGSVEMRGGCCLLTHSGTGGEGEGEPDKR